MEKVIEYFLREELEPEKVGTICLSTLEVESLETASWEHLAPSLHSGPVGLLASTVHCSVGSQTDGEAGRL